MTKFYVQNFGCRATQADAALIESGLRSQGYARSESRSAAGVVVLNTCTVTAAADQQARQAIREIRRANPATRIIVTGCYAQRAPGEIAALPGVTWVVGNAHQTEIAELLAGAPGILPERLAESANAWPTVPSPMAAPGGFFPVKLLQDGGGFPPAGAAKILTSEMRGLSSVPLAMPESAAGGRTRPTLKIQDGCDHHCAYCIIPSVRGRSRSVPPSDVARRVGELSEGGYREIVLSGINLGSYGQDLSPRASLRGLLARLLDETPVERLRLSSIEPVDVTQELIDVFARTPRLARHFHMPLQSGSDRVLRAMHRWYGAQQYARRVEYVHEAMSDAAIGADVIAGFPGETEDDHRATMELIAALPFAYLHVFSYSARPGTQAAELAEHVAPQVVRQRATELRALAENKRRKLTQARAGKAVRVLTLETVGPDCRAAISGNYQRVRVAARWPRNIWLTAWPTADGSVAPAEWCEQSSAHPNA
jgi:threonylcarbamoyladenosine tRNA methylthiotransferase MtaB